VTDQTDTPFRSRPEWYGKNISAAVRTFSRPGVMERPDGTEQAAVIIFRGKHVLSVLTHKDAVRLADQLIDATENPNC
jgi:hypothetical protein